MKVDLASERAASARASLAGSRRERTTSVRLARARGSERAPTLQCRAGSGRSVARLTICMLQAGRPTREQQVDGPAERAREREKMGESWMERLAVVSSPAISLRVGLGALCGTQMSLRRASSELVYKWPR